MILADVLEAFQLKPQEYNLLLLKVGGVISALIKRGCTKIALPQVGDFELTTRAGRACTTPQGLRITYPEKRTVKFKIKLALHKQINGVTE